ncbi:MAG: hypothetical protein HY314_16685 [Acidobacteria bacterium]|nr:hypothetical protein [Acidobacteriota bacterium]
MDLKLCPSLISGCGRLGASQPTAYALLYFAQLYGNQGPLPAEKAMRAAIERDGSTTSRVYHDHGGFFKKRPSPTVLLRRPPPERRRGQYTSHHDAVRGDRGVR